MLYYYILEISLAYDVIIIGGSYSGMAAALQLARAHRSVLILDGGKRRNRFADHSHGFLTQDGAPPQEIAATARKQLLAYPTVGWKDQIAIEVSGEQDSFSVRSEQQEVFEARRLIFAIGVTDTLPDIKGIQERWGQTIFHCPYCHGYELAKEDIAVIATGENSLHHALMLPDWGPTTFFTNGAIKLDDENEHRCKARGVEIDTTPIAEIIQTADIRLTDGRIRSFAGIFVGSVTTPSSPLPKLFGCTYEDTPFGSQIQSDALKETSIPGVYACGDAAKIPHSVTLAVADGAWAGACAHRSLIFG